MFINNDDATTDTFYVAVDKIDLQWSYVMVDPNNSIQSISSVGQKQRNLNLLMWIVDPLNSSPGEMNAKTIVPSTRSQQLTSSLYLLGDYPTLSNYDTNALNFSTPIYDSSKKYEFINQIMANKCFHF